MKIKISIFISLITLIGCNNSHICLQDYPFKNINREYLAISVDSSTNNSKGCEYFFKNSFHLNHITDLEASFYLSNDKFIMRFLDPESEEFPLFDLNLKDSISTTIKVIFSDTIDSLKCIHLKQFLTKEKLEVHVFRIENFQCNENRCLDCVFFVTKQYGVIGSYLTTIDTGKKIIIAPRGEIFKDYIDYSGFIPKKIE